MNERRWSLRPGGPAIADSRVIDAALAFAAAAIGVAGHLAARRDADIEAARWSFGALLFAVCAAAVLVTRRRRPIIGLALLVGVATAANVALGEPALFTGQIVFEFVVLFHAIGSWSTHRRAGVVVAVVIAIVGFLGAVGESGVLAAGAFAAAVVALPFAVGIAARLRRGYLEAIEARLLQAERERDERARRAVVEDRARLALELHDVVAHHVSLIGVQAGAARLTAQTDPAASEAALLGIERSSRAAVQEMHRLLDTLDPRDAAATEIGEADRARLPVPTLDRLDELVDGWRDAGLAVELGSDALDSLPVDLSASAYRFVEEALTNVARHSSARRARVDVRQVDGALVLDVADPGPPRHVEALAPTGRVGRGLAGLERRVALFAGNFDAGPTPEGGFRVRARLPLPS